MITKGQVTSAPAGYDANGRKVTLFSQQQPDGSIVHSIAVDARTYRDNGASLQGLTSANILAMARAIEGGSA